MLWDDNKAFNKHRQDTQASLPLQLLINAFLVLWGDDYIHLPLIEIQPQSSTQKIGIHILLYGIFIS